MAPKLNIEWLPQLRILIRNVLRQLRPLRSATVAINGSQQTFPPDVPAEKQAIIDAIQGNNFRH